MAFMFRSESKKPFVESADTELRPETKRFINLKEMLANRVASLLWGRGIKIDFKVTGYEVGRKRLREILEENDLLGIMFEVEKRISANGSEFVTCEFLNGMPRFAIADSNWPQGAGKILNFKTLDKALIFKRHLFDIMEIPTEELWTTTEVTRHFLRDQTKFLIPFFHGKKTEIDESKIPPKVWKHNLGYLPVWQIKNKPNYGLEADPDDTAVKYLQWELDKVTEAFYKELEKNQTRVISTVLPSDLASLGVDGSGLKNLINDYIFPLKISRSDFQQDPVSILMGDPRIDAYIFGIESLVNQYFIGSCYSPPFTSNSGTQQSSIQAFNEKALDMETTRNKRQQRIALLKDMIKVVIDIEKKFGKVGRFPDIEEIEITIPENIPVSTSDTLRRLQTEIPLGIMSKQAGIALSNDWDLEKASRELENIRKEQLKDIELGLAEAQDLKEKQFAENEGFKNNNQLDKGKPKEEATHVGKAEVHV